MCTQADAFDILKEVFYSCNSLFPNGINDAYLYGSYARGDFNEYSDIDILLIVDLCQEKIGKYRRDISAVASALSIKHNITISILLDPLQQFNKYKNVLPYYRNVLNDGIRYEGQR